ncbi:HipA domain-containing protein [Sporosarcina beigongshangi]|uniref:hypothetical protein n=1 Tax=Sporosarcina beigongshangi TaxID=2782538 RepID=UPI00193A455B|nr:hypothetical protein [Sporosarcina beigongshangi]
MRDISHWERIGFGGKSTLDKEELIDSETRQRYLIKYPRQFAVGTSWEDITELIAADIGRLLGLQMMDVEIVVRNGRRGSLLRNIIPLGVANEEGGVLLSGVVNYEEFLETRLKGLELIRAGIALMKQLDFWEATKLDFIEMNYFDILIGNQDRHPYNWMILFKSQNQKEFSKIYDNGASLGFRFDDKQLAEYLSNDIKLAKYMRNASVKAGLFEHKKVKAKDMLTYLKQSYFGESLSIINRIERFDFKRYYEIIDGYAILSDIQKEWLKVIISFRQQSILQWFREEE